MPAFSELVGLLQRQQAHRAGGKLVAAAEQAPNLAAVLAQRGPHQQHPRGAARLEQRQQRLELLRGERRRKIADRLPPQHAHGRVIRVVWLVLLQAVQQRDQLGAAVQPSAALISAS